MCGVIGLVYEHHHPRLGMIAADLLKTLEYRGYDSTGAAIQGEGTDVVLRKGVGAPSAMVHQLGIVGLAGRVLCGQVRWATFGAVTEQNSQPHQVRCKTHIYGAHNGNVTNCDDLKAWLTAEGHAVVSDNDGEMVVHTVEHFFAAELAALPVGESAAPRARQRAMRRALSTAAAHLKGSYAAVVIDPVTLTAWAIKQGSSLYFGFGTDAEFGNFCIASSDLSSVLKLTRVLLPLSEGQFIEFSAAGYQAYALLSGKHGAAGQALEKQPVRSRLRAKDTALLPGFETFMEQEIAAQEQTVRSLFTLFTGGSAAAHALGPHLSSIPEEDLRAIAEALDRLRDHYEDQQIRKAFHGLCDLPAMGRLRARVPPWLPAEGVNLAEHLASSEAGFLADLLPMARDGGDRETVLLIDAWLEQQEVVEYEGGLRRFTEVCGAALSASARIYAVCCGSSFHAAKAGAVFFNDIAGVELLPVLPGEFRGEHQRALQDGDVIIAVSQSGETKDLIDVLNQVEASGRRVGRIALVNNLNSTLAQEKADFVIPLRCGPEIAVPATKSFLNQVAVFYCLALRLAAHRGHDPRGVEERLRGLSALPGLIREAIASTEGEVELAAQLLYLCPSVHLLATRLTAVALEGALKIREVVLNHTEGFEGSEFKHGPNTILGFSTMYGPQQVGALLRRVGTCCERLVTEAHLRGIAPDGAARLCRAFCDSIFSPTGATRSVLEPAERALLAEAPARDELVRELYADYPLLYLTGPEEQDIHLTVSQINTHKIRGAHTVVIAEEHPALRQAASKAPAQAPGYSYVYIPLPRTGDTLLTIFLSTVVLQRLALRMSMRKMRYLDQLGVKDHGVHPDVPKNVSKSITVD
jgi:glucosamine 6-phosphate synthetase-like amidotransferase/phosphosugar isomerase protein